MGEHDDDGAAASSGVVAIVKKYNEEEKEEEKEESVEVEEEPEAGSDSRKYLLEIQRLKSFLLELDEEINAESQSSKRRIEELERAIINRDSIISELYNHSNNGKDDDDDDETGVIEQLQIDNEKLKELITSQEDVIKELDEKNNNLQTALMMLQSNSEREVDLKVLEAKRQVHQLESQLVETKGELEILKEFKRKNQSNEEILLKLTKDLDCRNYLIDQLNDEINSLRRQISKLIKGEGTTDGREGSIDKEYVRTMLLTVAQPPPKVTKSEVWMVLAKALGMTLEEMSRMGMRTIMTTPASNHITNDGSPRPSIHQGLSDVWISFLLHESQNINKY